MIDIKYHMFFDRQTVIKKVRDGTQSAEAKVGAFIRQRAKTSIRPRKRSANPGEPPSSHAGQLRDLIFFGWDAATESTVVGPKLFKSNKPTIPNVLEFGGASKNSKGKPATYHKFPFMAPALAAEVSKMPVAFQGCVKG